MSEESPNKTLSQRHRQLLRKGDSGRLRRREPGESDPGANGVTDPGLAVDSAAHTGTDGRRSDRLVDGRFRLLGRLGSGRLGEIYEARIDAGPESTLERLVALQLFDRRIAADLALIDKLRRGYAAVRAGPHRNIVRLHELGRDWKTWFLVMERLEGASLRFILDDAGPLSLGEAMPIVRAVGDALSYLHAKGMVHGAVRSSAVFVTEDFDVKLLDIVPAFPPSGLPAESTPDSRRASAPEIGDDVFGLACLAYELLTGRHPYNYSTPVEARRLGLEPAVIESLPTVRWQALARGLATVPEQRTASISVLMLDLGISGAERLSGSDRTAAADNAAASARPATSELPATSAPRATSAPPAPLERRTPLEPPAASAQTGSEGPESDWATPPWEASPGEESVITSARDRLAIAPAFLPERGHGAWFWSAFGAAVVGFLAAIVWVYQVPIRDVVVERLTAVGIDAATRGGDRAADRIAEPAGDAAPEAGAALETAPLRDEVARIDLPAAAPEPGRTAERPSLEAVTDQDTVTERSTVAEQQAVTERDSNAPGSDVDVVDEPAVAGQSDSAPEPPLSVSEDDGGIAAAPEPQVEPPVTAEFEAEALPPERFEPSRFAFASGQIRAEEGGGAAAVEVRRDGGIASRATIVWWTEEGTARATDDYADLGQQAETFEPGVETMTLYIPLLDDGIDEPPEGFLVSIGQSNPDTGRVETIATVGVIIEDDDNSPR